MTYDYKVTAFRVVDGDTYYLTLDVGFRITTVIECRLNGWDCPEKRSTAARTVLPYEKAAAVTAQQLATTWLTRSLSGGGLRVRTEQDPEKFGRWLGIPYDSLIGLEDSLGWFLHGERMAVPYAGTKKQPRWYEVFGQA